VYSKQHCTCFTLAVLNHSSALWRYYCVIIFVHNVFCFNKTFLIVMLGLNGQNNEGRSLFDKGSTNRENWEAKRLIKEFANNRWSVAAASINRLIKTNWKLRVNQTEVRQWLSQVCQDSWLTFQCFRTWYAVKMMLLAVRKAVVKYKNILNNATSLEYFLLSITTLLVADRPLTSINQTCSTDISSSVCFTR